MTAEPGAGEDTPHVAAAPFAPPDASSSPNGYPQPQQAFPAQGYPQQGYPAHGYPAQAYAAQGFPAEGYPLPQGFSPAPGYGYGYGFVPRGTTTNGLAIASLVLGIVFVYWIGSVLAVIFGHIALSQIKTHPYQSGRGMAIAGLILGYLWLSVLAVIVVAAVVAA